MADKIEYDTTGKPHPYHIVRPSVWPLFGSLAAGMLAVGAVLFMHDVEIQGIQVGLKGVLIGLASVLACMFFWWKDIIFESVAKKFITPSQKLACAFGMMLFIASEVMFFVAFFWAFFSGALYPTEAIGFIWPPADEYVVNAFDLPFMMTMILLLSGCTVTWAHHAILEDRKNDQVIQALLFTVLLGLGFLCFQVYEYSYLVKQGVGFADSIYTSAFYMATGFHGFHVLVGTIFLFVCWRRAKKDHFTKEKHFGFEAAAWYWHFVDVVWLFLFVAVYWWGNMIGMDMRPMQ